MRILATTTVAAALVALAACGQSGGVASDYNDGAGATTAEVAAVADMAVEAPAATSPNEGPPSATHVPAAAAQIAYAYRYVLELPRDRAPEMLRRHEQACVAAGAAVCQVLGSSSEQYGRDDLRARLELRATPAYITRFRAGLQDQAEAAGGRVAAASTDSEDLTRNLSDTEARLRALTTLRDRLQQLLATRSGPLEQLLQVERELARVQGELDAAQSALTLMRGRVATSRLTMEYRAQGSLAPDSALRPVNAALHNALGIFMATIAGLIIAVAAITPLALIAVPVVWLILRERRRRRAARAAATKT